MKMKPEHFETLRRAMSASLDAGAMLDVSTDDMSDERFRWDWLRRTTIEGKGSFQWVNENLYPYLNDSHIDTALRAIAGHSR